MEPLYEAGAGRWLEPLLSPAGRHMHSVVPHGYPAYARIFHPAQRDRPAETGSWRGHPGGEIADVRSEPVAWATVAGTFGKTMHATAQFHRLLPAAGDYGEVLDDDGWRYFEPHQGNLDVRQLAAAAAHLCRHTAAPDRGVAAVWDGWSGLASSAGFRQLTLSTGVATDPGDSSPFTSNAGTGSGLLPAEVANGPVLGLPGRNYYLFAAGARLFTDPGWTLNAPWHHDPHFPQSPSILWPEDRAWVLVTEIDFDSTVVAGSKDLVTALVRDPALEALIIREGTDLSWDADGENRPTREGRPNATSKWCRQGD